LYQLFLITFPGYFIYHYLVSKGWLPPILAGYSTPICLLSLPILGAVHLRFGLNSKGPSQPVELMLWVFLAYYMLVTVWQLSTRNMLNSADAHPTVIAQFLALYFLGHHTPCEHRQRPLLIVLMALMTGMIIHNSMSGGLIGAALESIGVSESLITYQGYAFAYFVTLTWTVALLHGHGAWRVLVYLLAFIALFLNGARSEFAAALIGFLVLEFLLAPSKSRAMLAAALAVLLFAAVYMVFEEELQEYRVITIFTDYSEDLSVLDRKKMYQDGLSTILTYPLAGRMGSYLGGEYIHNYLSAWVDLGAVGFAAFLVLSALPAVYLWLQRRHLKADHELQLLFMLTFSTLLLSFTAKPFTQYLLPLTLGVCLRHARSMSTHSRTRSEPAVRQRGAGLA
jgi:O-antigen ligase